MATNVAGTAEKGISGSVAGAGPQSAKSPIGRQRKRSTPTQVKTLGGVRTMKMYSLTEGELGELSQLQGFASVCFSISSACFGFWISVTQAIDFSENLAAIVLSTWNGWKIAALCLAALSAILGVYFWWRGDTRLNNIKLEMEHDK